MSRESKLLKNTGILAIGQLSSKIFTFLLLPLYTSKLSPDDYGNVDVLQTIISLVLYFATLQLESALFRFLVESRSDDKTSSKYITSALSTILLSNVIFTLVIIIVHLFFKFQYISLLILGIWSQAFYFAFSNIVRGFGRNSDYAIASFLVTLTSLIVNIALIVGLNLKGVSILIALVVSNLIGSLFLLFKTKLWKFLSKSSFDLSTIKEMLHYSIPLIPNAISWWVANASDRLIILWILGAGANGIYAAANKIPTIYTTVFSVFNLAWAESVSLSMRDKDKEDYICRMYNSSIKLFSFIDLGIICGMSLLFKILIGEEYSGAYNHIYILLVAIFFNSICSIIGGILTGYKDSKAIGISTVVGAVANFAINILCVKIIGLYAASVSTLCSYVIIMLMRKGKVNQHLKISIDKEFLIQLFFALIVVTIGYFSHDYIVNSIIMVCLAVWGFLNNKEMILGSFKTIVHKNRL